MPANSPLTVVIPPRGEQRERSESTEQLTEDSHALSRPRSHTVDIFVRFTVDMQREHGQGSYGQTFAAWDALNNNKEVVVKFVNTRRMENLLQKTLKECAILERLDHPNVIRILAHDHHRSHEHIYCIFLELASDKLFEIWWPPEEPGPIPMSEQRGREYLRQIAAGLEHCHSRGVAHRDLKLDNVLVHSDGTVKIIDFNLAYEYPCSATTGEPDVSVHPTGVAGRSLALALTAPALAERPMLTMAANPT